MATTTKRVTITDNSNDEVTAYSGVAKMTDDFKGQISLYDVDGNILAVVRKGGVSIQSVDE